MFDLSDKVIAITGGSGALGTAISHGMANAGATICIIARDAEKITKTVESIQKNGNDAVGFSADVLNKENVQQAANQIIEQFGKIDVLINAAGGNRSEATVTPGQQTFFDIPEDAMQWVFNLNFIGSIIPSQVFGNLFVAQNHGVILNVSSMAAFKPLTRVISYGAAKAAINNFTQWLAVHMATEYSPNIRVNAIAPGFFVGDQNRYLLYDKDTGALTARGQQIIDHTPMGRFGDPDELIGAVNWLVSDAAKFVTGIIVPIDGGFSAYGGV